MQKEIVVKIPVLEKVQKPVKKSKLLREIFSILQQVTLLMKHTRIAVAIIPDMCIQIKFKLAYFYSQTHKPLMK